MANATEAQKRATAKYTSQFSQLCLRIKPELKEQITLHCSSSGQSVNAFIVKALQNQLKLESNVSKKETM